MSSSGGGVSQFIGVKWATVVAAVALATGAIVVPVVTGGGGSQTANFWVDQSATTGCTDSPTLITYDDTKDCTFDQALDACDSGDTVIVRNDSYGDVTISGHPSGRTGMCNVSAADGAAVVIDEFENGFQTNDTGGDWFTVNANVANGGSITMKSLYSDQANQTVFDGVVVDAEFTDPDAGAYSQILHFENTPGAVFKNGIVRNACSETGQGGMVVITNINGVVLDNVNFYNAHACDPGGDPHTECIWASSANNVTLNRLSFSGCAVMDVFVTGWDGDTYASGWTVTNSWFERPCENNEAPPSSCTDPHNSPVGIHFRNGAGGESDPAPIPSGWTIQNNTFRGNLSINGGGSPPSPNVIRNNVFLGTASCGVANTTYSYNAHVSGSCGGTGSFTNASLLSNSFVDPTDLDGTPGDWHLLSGSPLRNVGTTAGITSVDRDGNPRNCGAAPDIGAYEYQADC